MTEEKKDKKVQIKVTLETRERLKRYGNKGQSYDDVINVILEVYSVHIDAYR